MQALEVHFGIDRVSCNYCKKNWRWVDCVQAIKFFCMQSVYTSKLITLLINLYVYNVLA